MLEARRESWVVVDGVAESVELEEYTLDGGDGIMALGSMTLVVVDADILKDGWECEW